MLCGFFGVYGVNRTFIRKKVGKSLQVYTMLGNGEMREGHSREAFMSAAHYKLDNLTFLIDNNGL